MKKNLLLFAAAPALLSGCSSSSDAFMPMPVVNLSCQSEQIVEADEEFYLNDEQHLLETLSFPALTTIGTLYLNNNPMLNSLQGFSNLTQIYGLNGDYSVMMDYNPALHTLNGLQDLTNTAALVEINAFSEHDLSNTCASSLLVNDYLAVAGNNHLDNHMSAYAHRAGYDYLLHHFSTYCQCH